MGQKKKGGRREWCPYYFQDYGQHKAVCIYYIIACYTNDGSRVTPVCHSRAAEDFQMSLSFFFPSSFS